MLIHQVVAGLKHAGFFLSLKTQSQEDWGSGSSQSTAARVPPPVRRQMATELLTKYRAIKPVMEGVESSSEDKEEGEELSQLNDSAVGRCWCYSIFNQ